MSLLTEINEQPQILQNILDNQAIFVRSPKRFGNINHGMFFWQPEAHRIMPAGMPIIYGVRITSIRSL